MSRFPLRILSNISARPPRPLRDAPAVAQLELREADSEPPRRRPLHPRLHLVPSRDLNAVVLIEPVVDGARRQAELQEGRPRATADRELATDAHPEDRVREAEMILHGLASRRDRVTERRLGRRLG